MALSGKSTSDGKGHGSTISFSHTVGAGDDRILDVLLMLRTNNGTPNDLEVDFNGSEALTRLTTYGFEPNVHAQMWRLSAPTATTADVVVTQLNGASHRIVACGISYAGADASTPTFSTEGANPGAAPSLVVSSAAGEVVVDAVAVWNDAASPRTLTVGASQTEEVNDEDVATTGVRGGASTEAGAATVTMSWAVGGGAEAYSHVAYAIKPAAAGGGGGGTAAQGNTLRWE
jgi:hypothetical protein